MTAIKTAVALACGASTLVASLVACGGSSEGPQANSSRSPSASLTPSPSPSPPKRLERVWLSLTASQAVEGKRRLSGTPGVDHTRFDSAAETFYVYFTPEITDDQRQHVRHVLYSLLRS